MVALEDVVCLELLDEMVWPDMMVNQDPQENKEALDQLAHSETLEPQESADKTPRNPLAAPDLVDPKENLAPPAQLVTTDMMVDPVDLDPKEPPAHKDLVDHQETPVFMVKKVLKDVPVTMPNIVPAHTVVDKMPELVVVMLLVDTLDVVLKRFTGNKVNDMFLMLFARFL